MELYLCNYLEQSKRLQYFVNLTSRLCVWSIGQGLRPVARKLTLNFLVTRHMSRVTISSPRLFFTQQRVPRTQRTTHLSPFSPSHSPTVTKSFRLQLCTLNHLVSQFLSLFANIRQTNFQTHNPSLSGQTNFIPLYLIPFIYLSPGTLLTTHHSFLTSFFIFFLPSP